MNCYKCGEEIEELDRSYDLCEKCHDHEMLIGIEEKEELEPEEAILAMLRGYELTVHKRSKYADGTVKWDGERFCLYNGKKFVLAIQCFDGLFMKKQHPMGRLEILAWVNSPESQGWLVSRKYVGDGDWEDWDLPQRFKYDGQEEYSDPCVISYRRARLLSDKSDIDQSTIQGFLSEAAD
jgi:hypothetical protein